MQPQSGSNRISLPITTTQTSVTSVTTITSQKPPFTRALSLPIGGKVSATQVRLQVSGYNNTNFCPICIETRTNDTLPRMDGRIQWRWLILYHQDTQLLNLQILLLDFFEANHPIQCYPENKNHDSPTFSSNKCFDSNASLTESNP